MDSAFTATAVVAQEISDGASVAGDIEPTQAIVLWLLVLLAAVTTLALAIAILRRAMAPRGVLNQAGLAMHQQYGDPATDNHFRVIPEPTEYVFTILVDDTEQVGPRCFICGRELLDGNHDHDP